MDQVKDQEVSHLPVMADHQMEDLQIGAGEPALQETIALLHAMPLMAEEVAVMAGAKILLPATEALQMVGVKDLVRHQEAREAFANQPKEK